jgi:Asp-tRNA(Asn)/Glu-tRNA(Gln) amidotransferase A subunit family amidase
MTGHPALTMPCAMHTLGLPIALQLVGRYFDEATVLRAAHAVERSGRFSIPRPNVDQ